MRGGLKKYIVPGPGRYWSPREDESTQAEFSVIKRKITCVSQLPL